MRKAFHERFAIGTISSMSTTPPVVHVKKPTSTRMTSIIPCETPGCTNQRLVGFKYCIDHNTGVQPTDAATAERRGRSSLVDGKVGAERRCRSPAASRRTSLPIRRAASSTLPKSHVPSDPDKMEYKDFEDLKDVVDPNTVLNRALSNLVRSNTNQTCWVWLVCVVCVVCCVCMYVCVM